MAFLTTNASCIPLMAAAMPRQSLIVVRAAAKPAEHQVQPAAKANGVYAAGRRQALMLLAAGAASTAIISQSARADVPTKMGGRTEIKDVTDPYVQDMGRWAVAEHNAKTGEKLQFDKVVCGQQQVVAGINYMLNVETKGPSDLYAAFVFDPLPSSPEKRDLKYFKPLLA